jgi:hypothetical protein
VQRDPFQVDRKLAETARAWLAFRRALRRGEGAEHRFEAVGRYASRELVLELRAASARDPLAPALATWAHRLHLEHATSELVAERERALRSERHALNAPEAGKFTLRELLDAALADTKGARRGFVEALGAHASKAGDLELERWEKLVEVSNGLGDAAGAVLPFGAPYGEELAAKWLEATDAAMAELGVEDFSSLLELALGRRSPAAWPARLTGRSLAGLFDEANWLDHVTLDAFDLPRALGAASFVRGLDAFGAALAGALAPRKLPFAVAHEPFDLRGAAFGALFALVPCGESFARRKLEVTRARLGEHRRALARALLVGTRGLALRVLLRRPTLAGRRTLTEAYPELVFRALRVELSPRTSAVLYRSRVSDGARLSGLFAAAERRARLERMHDEDWYRNPRAVAELVETTRQSAPEAPPAERLELGVDALATFVAEML